MLLSKTLLKTNISGLHAIHQDKYEKMDKNNRLLISQ